MASIPYRTALIVGAGPGISASLARQLAAEGLSVALAARDTAKLADIVRETGATAFAVDATDPAAVAALFQSVDERLGEPDVVIYNASARVPGPVAELDPEAVRQSLQVSAFGGFLAVQQAAKRMVPRGQGAILLTGASASAARELGPRGVHVAHFNIDGGVRSARRPDPTERPDSTLSPDGIAQTYLDVLRQPRNAWSLEVELRPWVETF
jgi:NAD(P)-dependent dehydrogenase (short-subunit alcohol dehydrogenase family)